MGEVLDGASENVATVDGLQDVADLDASSCSRAIREDCSYADLCVQLQMNCWGANKVQSLCGTHFCGLVVLNEMSPDGGGRTSLHPLIKSFP